MKIRFLCGAAALAASALSAIPATAQLVDTQSVEDQRQQVRNVIVYGNDPCPAERGDEIVVCARRPESERYRLPPETQAPNPADRRSALQRQQEIREATDTGTDSCSAVGPGGHTGCLQQQINRSRVGMDSDEPTPANEPD
jgi:hypothetical protein